MLIPPVPTEIGLQSFCAEVCKEALFLSFDLRMAGYLCLRLALATDKADQITDRSIIVHLCYQLYSPSIYRWAD
eukprot:11511686-Karenia_brevis.AAC.1